MVTLDAIRRLARTLPGVEEGTSYGTAAFRASKKFLARMYPDDLALVLKVGETEQEFLIDAEPDIFYITDHYRGTSLVLVRLAEIDADAFERLFVRSWRQVASKKDIATFDAESQAKGAKGGSFAE